MNKSPCENCGSQDWHRATFVGSLPSRCNECPKSYSPRLFFSGNGFTGALKYGTNQPTYRDMVKEGYIQPGRYDLLTQNK